MTKILSSMTLLEIVELKPETVDIFRKFEKAAGSCLLCNHLFDSLENVASEYKLNLDHLLASLEKPKQEQILPNKITE